MIIAGLINPIFGQIIPLPILEDKTYSATDIGNLLGITSKAVGKIANDHNLKTEQYGIFVLDKSRSSNKQVSVFRYNERGLNAIKNIFGGNGSAWLISECLDEIIQDLDNLPTEDQSARGNSND